MGRAKKKKRADERKELVKLEEIEARIASERSVIKHVERITYWISLFSIILLNFFISLVFIPLFVMLSADFNYLLVAINGLIIGYLLNLIVNSLETLEEHHHSIIVLIVPLIGVINLIVVVEAANNLGSLASLNINNPVPLTLFYLVFFLLPFVASRSRHLLSRRFSREHKIN